MNDLFVHSHLFFSWNTLSNLYKIFRTKKLLVLIFILVNLF